MWTWIDVQKAIQGKREATLRLGVEAQLPHKVLRFIK